VTLLFNTDSRVKTDTDCNYANQHSVDMSRSLSYDLRRFGNNNILELERHVCSQNFFTYTV